LIDTNVIIVVFVAAVVALLFARVAAIDRVPSTEGIALTRFQSLATLLTSCCNAALRRRRGVQRGASRGRGGDSA
jgi:hypothetical protein